MARTLYLNDGSTEYVLSDETEVLKRIIGEHLGRGCEELFQEIMDECWEHKYASEDWEKIADGYFNMLMDTLNSLKEELDKPRLNRKHIETIYNDLDKNL